MAGRRAYAEADVLVFGSGPAGASTARAVLRHGYSVAVIEATRQPGTHYFGNGETLPPGADRLLDRLFDASHDLLAEDLTIPSFGNRFAWGDAQLACNDFVLNPYGQGWHLDRIRFDRSLRHCMLSAGVMFPGGSLSRKPVRLPEGWLFSFDDGNVRSIRARFAVDATGRRARFARMQGATRIRHDQGIAVVMLLNVEDDASDERVTLVEAVENGWWCTAPMPGCRRMAMLVTDRDLLDVRLARSIEGWWGAMSFTTHVAARLAAVGARPLGQPRTLAADTSFLSTVSGDGWIAVGDAAASFDPISAQGIVSALDFGARAGGMLALALRGEETATKRYERMYRSAISSYLDQRRVCYLNETRWPHAPFWRRRRN